MTNLNLFSRYVKCALANLYDRVQLQTSPLIGLLNIGRTSEEPAATALRRILREGIEALRPETAIPFSDPAWLGYRLLWSRYVHRRSADAVAEELGLSRTSYYRYHQQALDAMTRMLWDQYNPSRMIATEQASRSLPYISAQLAVNEAVKLAQESPRHPVDLDELLTSVREIIAPLAEQQGLSLVVRSSGGLPTTFADPGMLRQALLSLLGEAMELACGPTLLLQMGARAKETVWHLGALGDSPYSELDVEGRNGVILARELLGVYGGRLWIEPDGDRLAIVFSLPVVEPPTVLIIDDDGDIIRLYRSWLQMGHYEGHMARSWEELEAQLAEKIPDLVLLDVLMPQWDGWSVLQYLRTLPQTAEVPVIVCSVLSQPRLALALGAAAVLSKPITEQELLRTIRETLGQANSRA